MNGSPTVYVVDDEPSVRRSLERLLRSEGYAVETFGSAEEILSQPSPTGPGCLVLDVDLPGSNGLDLQAALAAKANPLPVVFITGHGDIPMTVRAMRAGAEDFLPKPFDCEVLLAAVGRGLARNERARTQEGRLAELRRRLTNLSPREHEVMALVVTGLLNKQVGHRLGVTEKTVKVHRGRVMQKMGARSLADLVRMAQEIEGAEAAPR